MRPASSVILFTTASGAGYGLLFLLGGLVAFYNIWKTIQASGSEIQAGDQPIATTQAAE